MKDLRVAIIGGGIGGAAAAAAMHKQGIKAHVYEQAPILGEVGAGIGMRPPTVRYFKEWGIYDRIAEKSRQSEFMEILDADGNVFIKEKWPVLTDNPEERWSRLIHRADLLETMMSAVPEEYTHLDHRLEDIIEHEDHAEVTFANGVKVEADLVIGADGIRSLVRSKMIKEIEPVYSGFHAYRALVDEKDVFGMASDESILRIYVDGAYQMYLLPLHNRKQVSVDITAPSQDASWRPEVTKEMMLDCLKNFHPNIRKIVENMNIEDFTCRTLYDIDPLDRWSTKHVTLLGDAAHAMLHNQGQGANMAIQDGGALAVCLEESATIAEALGKYEAQRLPVTKLYQELSRLFPSEQAETAFPEKEHFEKKVEVN